MPEPCPLHGTPTHTPGTHGCGSKLALLGSQLPRCSHSCQPPLPNLCRARFQVRGESQDALSDRWAGKDPGGGNILAKAWLPVLTEVSPREIHRGSSVVPFAGPKYPKSCFCAREGSSIEIFGLETPTVCFMFFLQNHPQISTMQKLK